jgi:hypothetical protein
MPHAGATTVLGEVQSMILARLQLARNKQETTCMRPPKNAFCCPHTFFVEMRVEHVHLALSQRHAQRTPEYSNSYMKKNE